MRGTPTDPVDSPWRRRAVIAFIALWLTVQITFPILQKLDGWTFRYRYTRFSWAMFSRTPPAYEVRLYRTRANGGVEPIPDIERYVRGYRSPAPMDKLAIYVSEEEVHDRFSRLVSHVARQQHDGYTYVASIRWTGQRHDIPSVMEFRADAVQ